MFNARQIVFSVALVALSVVSQAFVKCDAIPSPQYLAMQAQQYQPNDADFDSAMDGWRSGDAGDYPDTFRNLKPLAEHGDMVSAYYLGLMYHRGLGVAHDNSQAVVWLRKAADQGYAPAQNQLGLMLAKGQGIAPDRSQALVLFRKAAKQGLVDAQFNLGYSLSNESGTNHKEAIFWLRKAAQQGNPLYQLAVANVFDSSASNKQLLRESAYWARKAAEQGVGRAQLLTGEDYLYGIGVPRNYVQALRWLQLAYQQGSAAAADRLGYMHLKGFGVRKDQAAAIEWFCKSAQFGLGTGLGELDSLGDAGFSCILKAANEGDVAAELMVAGHYDHAGELAKAVAWYRKSAEQGYAFAEDALGDMYASGRGVPRDPVLALMFYQLSHISRSSGASSAWKMRQSLSDAQKAEADALATAWVKNTPFPETSRPGRADTPAAKPQEN